MEISQSLPAGVPQNQLRAGRALQHEGVQAESNIKEPAPTDATRDAFKDFVGQTFFAQMIKSLRSSQQPSAYFHGGRAEEIFQGQFDQVLTEELSDASADKIADPMFELFMLGRSK